MERQILRTCALLGTAIALAASACSTTSPDTHQHCTRKVQRSITYGGQSAQVERCVEWQFGPSRHQTERFEAGRSARP